MAIQDVCVLFVAFNDTQVYVNLGDLLDILVLINNGINFILYCSMSKQFRDTFVSVLRLDYICPSAVPSQPFDSGSCMDKQQRRPSAVTATAGLCQTANRVKQTVGNGIMTVAGNPSTGGAKVKTTEFNKLSMTANRMNRISCDTDD
jgi:hypothetical protein